MPQDRVIDLPEAEVEKRLGRELPHAVAQEFEYNGQRYRVRQRDPLRLEAGVPCELIGQPPEMDIPQSRSRTRR
ncbi:MAG: hypothetical protein HY765_07910 [Rhodomicrobium sp.]|nr:hypothetical protein [Rhodomicrobium sp.]